MWSELVSSGRDGLLMPRKWLLLLVVLWVVVDQITKFLADNHLQYGEPYTVFTGFDLLLSYNRGAAFSFLHDSGGWQRWLFTAISLGVSVVIAFWLFVKDEPASALQKLALTCILGGAVGNLIDRAWQGYVVDFISVYWGESRFATFNIADSAISIGAALLVLDIVLASRREKHEGQ